MILSCPACGTQYVVKDGAIPAGGRQVRCAACKHSWHQDPEDSAGEELQGQEERSEAIAGEAEERTPADGVQDDEAGGDAMPESSEELAGYAAVDPLAPPAEALVEPPMPAPVPPDEEAYPEPAEPAPGPPADDDFSPFAERDPDMEERRSPLRRILIALLLLLAIAAAFWFLAPQEWRTRLGLGGQAETPLQLMMTHSDRQRLESGNELLAVTGRVINPTDKSQTVPPIQAQLRSQSGELVYSWTIAPPARTLPPGGSATFNSAEVNVPAGGDELTISLGAPRA